MDLLTRRQAWSLSWPMIFANATVPLAGVVDTLVLGSVGDKTDLGGVALGALVFTVLFHSLYFLRMSSTGLAAQAAGAGREAETQRVLLRGLVLAILLGVAVLALRGPIAGLAFAVLQGGTRVEGVGAGYFGWRSLGAPGAFASLVVTGWLIALGRTRTVLVVQGIASGVNVVLDLWFVLGLGWGAAGVGGATAVADWVGAAAALVLAAGVVSKRGGLAREALRADALLDLAALRQVFGVNLDLLIRNWALLVGFGWFANAGAKQGTAVLAGNHVLLQIITTAAFVLDAFAFTAESEVGRATGARSVPGLKRAIRVTGELSFAAGFVFMVGTFVSGRWLLAHLIADAEARSAALSALPYCAVIPFIGAAAWQLDGTFIGAMRSVAMRNAAVVAAALYIGLDLALTGVWGPRGLWLAFIGFYVARAGTLLVGLPGLMRAAQPRA